MADKKVDATTGEIKENKGWIRGPALIDELPMDVVPMEEPPHFTVHCKPVYNYQSVEFDFDVRYGVEEQDLKLMEDLYSKMLEMLVRVSQNAPQKEAGKPSAPVEELASEKQKEILRNFHIEFKEPLTKKQAHALIKKSMDQDIF